MGISDLALGTPRGLYSTADYNDASNNNKRKRADILKEREEIEQEHRRKREEEGVVCVCGIKYHPDIDAMHARTVEHCNFLRQTEGVMCECGVKYHPMIDNVHHRYDPRHISFLRLRAACECGMTLQRRWMPSHKLSKVHTQRMERIRKGIVPGAPRKPRLSSKQLLFD